MASLDFEGRKVPVENDDTIASALFRAGVRIFSRSFKYHRPRGLYCLTGDCSSCILTVNGEPGVRSCISRAADGQQVVRGNGWPSSDNDLLAAVGRIRAALPVNAPYKSLLRPRWAWRFTEKLVRGLTGIAHVRLDTQPKDRERRAHHPDVLVIGGGVAGLSAALGAAQSGSSVLLVDEGQLADKLPPGPARVVVQDLAQKLRAEPRARIIERATAIGIYEGPLVPVTADDFLHMVLPQRIIVATGAIERHAVFPGNDLPGVWLGRGAARLAGVHKLKPGNSAVVSVATREGIEHLSTLLAAGVVIKAVIAPDDIADALPPELRVIRNGSIAAARGRRQLRDVVINTASGTETIACDALVVSTGVTPRDGLLRQTAPGEVVGAGEVVLPGCTVDEALESGRWAGAGEESAVSAQPLPESPVSGFVCLCEDVKVEDLETAWQDGYHATELLKRYSKTTAGACQGAMCHMHLRAFVHARAPGTIWTNATTARPPARAVRLEDVAAGIRTPVEYRTALHDNHVSLGATMEWAGVWKRPSNYGDTLAEYWAVRKGVSLMDVGTLGKYRVAGPDATAFLERIYPCRVADIKPGALRYALLLNEAGYVFDDGLIGSLGDAGYYLTLTTGGADHAEAWFRDWAEAWGMHVHIANITTTFGAINVAGPQARELLARLTTAPLDTASFGYSKFKQIEVAGIPCYALRVGFLGELSFELHHPSLRSVELWNALSEAGADLDVRPHGLDALRMLRLEKGHIIIGQDTDFDATPVKLGLPWAVKMDKPSFIGKTSLQRVGQDPAHRTLVQITFPGEAVPVEGAQLLVNNEHAGRITSCRFSPVLGHGVALAWLRATGEKPKSVVALMENNKRIEGTLTHGPFYDPEGVRLRA